MDLDRLYTETFSYTNLIWLTSSWFTYFDTFANANLLASVNFSFSLYFVLSALKIAYEILMI